MAVTGGDVSSSFRARVAHVVSAVREAFTARPAAPILTPQQREAATRDAALRGVGATLDRVGELRRGLAAGGQAPPIVPGAGWSQSLDPVLRDDAEQQRIWGSVEAKYGRASTTYGITPQAYPTFSATELTLERIAQIHHEADAQGFLHRKADMDYFINRSSSQIQMAHRQRIAPLYRTRLEVTPADRSSLAWAVTAFVRRVLDRIPALQKAEEDLASAAAHGYSGLEIVYSTPHDLPVAVSSRRTVTVKGVRGVSSLEWIHPRTFRWHPIKKKMALDAGGGRYIDPFENPDKSPTRKLIFHATSAQGHPHQLGYDWAAAPLVMLGKQSLARWSVMLEFFGISTPYMVWDEEKFASPEDGAAALAFLGAIGQGRPAFLPRKIGEGVKNTETPTGIDARGQHAAILGYVAAELSKLVMGQTLSAEAGGSGSYALANVQGDSKEEVQVIDASLASDTMTHQLVVFLIEENLPSLCRAFGASPDQIRAVFPRAYRSVDRRMDPTARLKLYLDYEGHGAAAAGTGTYLSEAPAPKPGGRRRVDWDRVAAELAIPLMQDEPGEDVAPQPEQPDHDDASDDAADKPATPDASGADIAITGTDTATIVSVNEAREQMGLGPVADGELTIAEYKAKHGDAIAAAAPEPEPPADEPADDASEDDGESSNPIDRPPAVDLDKAEAADHAEHHAPTLAE